MLGGRISGRAITALLGLSLAVFEGLALFGKARAASPSSATADVSVTILAPVPVVSVIDVLPPAISTTGAVLIHLGSADWVSVPVVSNAAVAATPTVISAAVKTAQSGDGTLSGGMAVNVSSSPPVAGDADPVRVLVEFN